MSNTTNTTLIENYLDQYDISELSDEELRVLEQQIYEQES